MRFSQIISGVGVSMSVSVLRKHDLYFSCYSDVNHNHP